MEEEEEEKTYLVDEQVAEDTGARDDHVNTGAVQLLQGDELEFVDAADGVGDGTDASQSQDLEEVGGWVGEKMEEEEGVGMSYCGFWVGG